MHVHKLCLHFTACTDDGCSMDKWLSKLESSNWLTHVKDILTCACTVAQCIDSEGKSGKFLSKLGSNLFTIFFMLIDLDNAPSEFKKA